MTTTDEAPGPPGASLLSEQLPGVAVWDLDAEADWAAAAGSGRDVLVVDRRTTLPEAARAVAALRGGAAVACATDPVTDTVKAVVDDRVVGTVDRDLLARVRPPLALSADLAGDRPAPERGGLATWLEPLRGRARVVLLDPGR